MHNLRLTISLLIVILVPRASVSAQNLDWAVGAQDVPLGTSCRWTRADHGFEVDELDRPIVRRLLVSNNPEKLSSSMTNRAMVFDESQAEGCVNYQVFLWHLNDAAAPIQNGFTVALVVQNLSANNAVIVTRAGVWGWAPAPLTGSPEQAWLGRSLSYAGLSGNWSLPDPQGQWSQDHMQTDTGTTNIAADGKQVVMAAYVPGVRLVGGQWRVTVAWAAPQAVPLRCRVFSVWMPGDQTGAQGLEALCNEADEGRLVPDPFVPRTLRGGHARGAWATSQIELDNELKPVVLAGSGATAHLPICDAPAATAPTVPWLGDGTSTARVGDDTLYHLAHSFDAGRARSLLGMYGVRIDAKVWVKSTSGTHTVQVYLRRCAEFPYVGALQYGASLRRVYLPRDGIAKETTQLIGEVDSVGTTPVAIPLTLMNNGPGGMPIHIVLRRKT